MIWRATFKSQDYLVKGKADKADSAPLDPFPDKHLF